MKGEPPADWNTEAHVEATKDKEEFRNYEDACERVKAFYKEQHGITELSLLSELVS